MVSVGDVLDDFQIVRELARSGMATVFKAHQRCTGRTVVLKIPHLEFESDVVFASRFQREEQIGLRLHHPAIAQTLSVSGKSRPYLAMEYIEGTPLHHVMRDDGPLLLDQALTIARDVCSALVHMHARWPRAFPPSAPRALPASSPTSCRSVLCARPTPRRTAADCGSGLPARARRPSSS